jgi:hypothetical protein
MMASVVDGIADGARIAAEFTMKQKKDTRNSYWWVALVENSHESTGGGEEWNKLENP